MSGAPSPFRFITPRRQPQQQFGGSRLRFVTPGIRQQGGGGGEAGSEISVMGAAGRRFLGPRAFLTSGQKRTETVEGDSDDDETEGGDGRGGHVSDYGSGRGLGRDNIWDAVEDGPDSSPVKRRRVEARVGVEEEIGKDMIVPMSREGGPKGEGEVGDVVEDIEVNSSDEDNGGKTEEGGVEEEENGLGDDDTGSGIDDVILGDFIRRRAILGEGGDRDGNEDVLHRDEEEDDSGLRSSPTPAAHSKNSTSTTKTQSPACPTNPAPTAVGSALFTPTPVSNLNPTTPAATTRKPPRFRISTPVPAPAPALPLTTAPSTSATASTTATTTKPTKPASAYFRTIRPPPNQRNPYSQSSNSVELPLGLAISSDWSPSKNPRWRAKAGAAGGSRLKGSSAGRRSGGGKFVEGGLASQVLGWTLEALSLGGGGGIFGYAGSGSSRSAGSGLGELEGWRRVIILGVQGEGGGKGCKGGLEGNLALGGVLVNGEETYGSRTERRRYLLVTGRRAVGGINTRGLEKLGKVGGEVRYRNPWWDVELGRGEEGKAKGEREGEEGYRVLCAWDVGRGVTEEEQGSE
ncbi:hypothetical protein L211DRAFT_467123 [Terfezia boudieri ATCC MYA-4762]|uniref:Uncharacterized protein n=1 Tax=Terfezia boudieri ATCC MYA-4762 TaxID=1051890 RepID=A0A3N4LY58_9PEZI|nr:hypothetical protein L211DRAFT_467123 [Terfezia boudieri ATCC MYA-4762]